MDIALVVVFEDCSAGNFGEIPPVKALVDLEADLTFANSAKKEVANSLQSERTVRLPFRRELEKAMQGSTYGLTTLGLVLGFGL